MDYRDIGLLSLLVFLLILSAACLALLTMPNKSTVYVTDTKGETKIYRNSYVNNRPFSNKTVIETPNAEISVPNGYQIKVKD